MADISSVANLGRIWGQRILNNGGLSIIGRRQLGTVEYALHPDRTLLEPVVDIAPQRDMDYHTMYSVNCISGRPQISFMNTGVYNYLINRSTLTDPLNFSFTSESNPEILFVGYPMKIHEIGCKEEGHLFWKQRTPVYGAEYCTIKDLAPNIQSEELCIQLTYFNPCTQRYLEYGNYGRRLILINHLVLPKMLAHELIAELEKDFNILHAIFHYFVYPAYGQCYHPVISRNGDVKLIGENDIFEEDDKKLHELGLGNMIKSLWDYLYIRRTFSYDPLSISGMIF